MKILLFFVKVLELFAFQDLENKILDIYFGQVSA